MIIKNHINFDLSKESMHSTISPELKDLVLRMLEKKPSRRISIPEIWQHPWISKYKEQRRKTLIADRFSSKSSTSIISHSIQLNNQGPIREEDEDNIEFKLSHNRDDKIELIQLDTAESIA